MQPITKDTVLHLASLSRLAVSPKEASALAEDLGALVNLANSLAPLPADEEAVHAVPLSALRSDAVTEGLSRKELLAAAPVHDAETVTVPRTVEE